MVWKRSSSRNRIQRKSPRRPLRFRECWRRHTWLFCNPSYPHHIKSRSDMRSDRCLNRYEDSVCSMYVFLILLQGRPSQWIEMKPGRRKFVLWIKVPEPDFISRISGNFRAFKIRGQLLKICNISLLCCKQLSWTTSSQSPHFIY
jgi:hypothetical protein